MSLAPTEGPSPRTGLRTMYFDYCFNEMPSESTFSHINDWRKIVLLQTAKTYTAQHPQARFALLRTWSHSHFWPTMVGIDKRSGTSFFDPRGRSWQWKFYPKEWQGKFLSHLWASCTSVTDLTCRSRIQRLAQQRPSLPTIQVPAG